MTKLVSVIIATYNSSSFIIETLESISKQTWKEIELIITDDCSSDGTMDLCNRWLDENKNRFSDFALLTSERNTGVSANANRGLNTAEGEWIKFLGADDTLKPDCLEQNMAWIAAHPEIKVLFSKIEIYRDNFNPQNLISITPGDADNPKGILVQGRSAESQYKMLLLSDRIHFSPSVFLHRETLLSIGGFDERLRLLEDYPLWLNLTGSGYKLYFMDKVTVNYRRHSKAINNTGIDYLINPNYFRSEDFRKLYTYPFLPIDLRLDQRFIWFVSKIFKNRFLRMNTRLNRSLYLLISVYFNPFKYFIYFRKKIFGKIDKNEFYN